MAKHKCDLCDRKKTIVNEQINKEGECYFRMCKDCSNAVVREERKQTLIIERQGAK